jgi:hypothetical protein
MHLTQKHIRQLALWLVSAVLAALVTNFFVSWAQERGWYDRPSARVAAMISYLSMPTASAWFHWAGGAIIGFAAGVWLDSILKRRNQNITATSEANNFSKWPKVYKPTSITGKNFRNERVLLDGFYYSHCDFVNVKFIYNGTTAVQLTNSTLNGVILESENPAVDGALSLAKGLGLLRADIRFNIGPGSVVSPPRMAPPSESSLIDPPAASPPSPAPPK